MESKQFIRPGANRSAMGRIGQDLQRGDELFWPTPDIGKGLFLVFSGHRYALFVVCQTTAQDALSQQT
ncbi:MAG: hypothetical protein GY761_03470 [Hyphomicrobiales bacterium]|nr:hypothetical protein [Hyphomicrobiales bacterium]